MTRTRAQRAKAAENRIKAMSHALRRAIFLYFIEHGTVSPSEIAAAWGEEDVANISYHCKKLEKYEAIELVRTEPVRGALKHYYRATERHLIDTDEWGELDPTIREGLLADFMQPAVDDFSSSAKAGILGSNPDFVVTRTPLKGMDRQGLQEAREIHERAFGEILELPARCAERMKVSGEQPISVSSAQLCFEVPHF